MSEWSVGAFLNIVRDRILPVATFEVSTSLEAMRLLRVLIVALLGLFAVVAGLIMAAAVSLATAFVLFVQRMTRSSVRSRIPAGRPQPPSRSSSSTGDVIEVTATEVPVDSAPR